MEQFPKEDKLDCERQLPPVAGRPDIAHLVKFTPALVKVSGWQPPKVLILAVDCSCSSH
jgi:hypothetical protein